ncbi:hypothetical protein ONZ45_g806 [Pleurotus djamor]|nr:hypothetical protein ONZ45_g806 [Pleurotus djamor]
MDSQPTIQFPSISPHEAPCYYLGVCSSPPTLLYRSDWSTKPWVQPKLGEWPTLKRIIGVYNHKLVDVWEFDVAPQIVLILKNRGVAWTSVDVCRFITQGKDHIRSKDIKGPVVLWVGIHPTRGNTTDRAQKICQSGDDIMNLLRSFAILDVNVEFRESTVVRQKGASLLPASFLPSHPTVNLRIPLTPSLGLGIAVSDKNASWSEGTTALYVAEGGTSKVILGLTCRHVLLDEHAYPSQPSSPDSTTRRNVYLLGPSALDQLLKNIQHDIHANKIAESLGQEAMAHLHATLPQNPGVDAVAQQLLKTHRDLEEVPAARQTLRRFLVDVNKDWAKPEQRVIGHVRDAPKIAHNNDGYMDDWGVYEIDQDRMTDAFKGNVIDLGTKIDAVRFIMTMDAEGNSGFQYPFDRLLRLQNIIPKEPLLKPTKLDDNTVPLDSHFVIKRGAATGLTIGRASGILSIVHDEDTNTESYEWPIFNYDGDSPFCAPGDSGSVIVDGKGRIGGMLTTSVRRDGLTSASFITYATPMYRIWEEVRKVFPNAHLSPTISV